MNFYRCVAPCANQPEQTTTALCDSREIASAGAESESDYSAFIHIYFVSPATFCLVVRDAVHGAECTRVPLLKSHRVEKAAARMKIGAGTFSASLETRALSCLKNLLTQAAYANSLQLRNAPLVGEVHFLSTPGVKIFRI